MDVEKAKRKNNVSSVTLKTGKTVFIKNCPNKSGRTLYRAAFLNSPFTTKEAMQVIKKLSKEKVK